MRSQVVNLKKLETSYLQMVREGKKRRSQVTLMYMLALLGIEYIICSMASRCVSAISALHPSIAAPWAAIEADTH